MKLRYFSLLLIASASSFGQGLNPKPVKALGAPRLIATQASPLAVDSANPNWVDGRELSSPTGIAVDNAANPTALYISDTGNNRVLGWRFGNQFTAGAPADIVIGQPNLFTTIAAGPGTSASLGLRAPTGIVVDAAGNLYVADSNNNRVLRFPTPFSPPNGVIQPDLVLGQSSFGSSTANLNGISATSLNLNAGGGFPGFIGMVFDTAGSLYVSDAGNNRILVYPSSVLKANNNGPAATLVIGQVNLTSATPSSGRLSTNTLSAPNSLAIDVKGRLYAGDGQARVLVFQPPFILGSSATRLVGIPTQTAGQPPPAPISNTTIGFVQGVTIVGNRLIAVDPAYHRALIYDALENWPDPSVALSPTAPYVTGQSGYADHTANRGMGEPSFVTLSSPFGAAASTNELFIADTGNNRILVYPVLNGLPSQSASRVIGQLFPNGNAVNLIEGREFSLVSSARTGAIAIDRSTTPPHLYVADTGNNRILGFKDAVNVKAGDVADLVIGQPDVFRAVANYPSGDGTKPTASSLFLPSGIALDSAGNLFVADSGNGRVLRFPTPFAQPAGMQTANLVLGQSSFGTQIKDPTATTMNAPVGVAVTSDGSLYVSDLALNRVLYFPQPLATGKAATKVVGQTDFNSGGPNGSPVSMGGDPARFINPRGIALDALDRLYVCDGGSARVAIFSAPASLAVTHAPPVLSLAAGLSQPIGLAIAPPNAPNPGEIWIADAGNNQMSHYSPFAFLGQTSTADANVPVNTPVSVAYDPFNNLMAADGTSRVLFYVPLLAVTNGANYLTRAAAPGGIISIFPSPSTNVLGTTTANFNSLPNPLPLPTALGDTQVLINQLPVALFYVSPGQINLPLPIGLPTTGSVDLRVVSKSTGQIYGATDLAMTAVSPGLFTLSATGSGQLAALNEDNTVNSPANPLTRGHILQIFGTGQGPVSNPPMDGVPSMGTSLTLADPQLLIGSVTATPSDVLYSGLAPGLIGVWQINVRISTTITAGSAVPITVSLSSVPTNDPSNPAAIRTTIALQ